MATIDPQPAAAARWDADEAVERLYAVHYRGLVRLSALLVGDVGTAEEVVQDSFVALHDHWGRLRDPGRGLAYLRRTVVNRSRSALRRRAVRERYAEAPPRPVLAVAPGADSDALVGERRRAVIAALQRLPRRQREVLALRYYLDLDEAGIARLLGISAGAVKSHASRGSATLRVLLEGVA